MTPHAKGNLQNNRTVNSVECTCHKIWHICRCACYKCIICYKCACVCLGILHYVFPLYCTYQTFQQKT